MWNALALCRCRHQVATPYATMKQARRSASSISVDRLRAFVHRVYLHSGKLGDLKVTGAKHAAIPLSYLSFIRRNSQLRARLTESVSYPTPNGMYGTQFALKRNIACNSSTMTVSSSPSTAEPPRSGSVLAEVEGEDVRLITF